MLAIFEDSQMTDRIRSKALKLYLEACLDIDPFQKLQVPSGQAVLNDLSNLDLTGDDLIEAIQQKRYTYKIKATRVRIPPRIHNLKTMMQEFLKQTNGVLNPDDPDRNEMIVSVLRTVKFMINHGFYETT